MLFNGYKSLQMQKFYVIEIENKDNQIGYLTDTPKGQMIATEVTANITQFKNWESANRILKKMNVKKGAVLSNQDLIEKGIGVKSGVGTLFYLENEKQEKLFFDPKRQGYYFKAADVGYCCWIDKPTIKTFVEEMNFSEETFVKVHQPVLRPNGS